MHCFSTLNTYTNSVGTCMPIVIENTHSAAYFLVPNDLTFLALYFLTNSDLMTVMDMCPGNRRMV